MRPHDVLGVRPGATRPEVTEAFRRFARVHHPDRGGDPRRFRAGVEAYRRLLGAPPPERPAGTGPADVVFHRRSRPDLASVLRSAGHRLSRVRFRS